MLGRWATIIGLSMTPALLAGPSAACAAGIAWHVNVWLLVSIVATASYAEGILVTLLAGRLTNAGFVGHWLERLRTPKAVALAEKWGTWGGLFLGAAVVGQEPILIALRCLGVHSRRIWLPLAFSNLVFSAVYYVIVSEGWDHLSSLF